MKGDTEAKIESGLDLVDQDGTHWIAERYAQSNTNPLTADGRGTLELVEGGGAGPLPTSGSDLLGGQITPFPLTLDRTEHTITVPLEVIAQHLRPGHTLTLQLVATTVAHKSPRLGGTVDFTNIAITLSMAAKGVTKAS